MTKTIAVGFIGTGIMGGHMARHLAEAGFAVTAWNRTREKAAALAPHGVAIADGPFAAAKDADVVVVMVSDGPACDSVIFGAGGDDGILAVMRAGAALVVMSSIPMEVATAQAKAANEMGIRYLDAPVSGGEPGARDGTLTIMAGGERDAFDDLQPVFSAMGRSTYIGAAGTGSLAKLANQAIVGNTMQTVAEALLLAQRGGADPDAVITALQGGFADSPILQNHGRRMIAGNFKPGARSAIQLKDMETAVALARELALDLPVTNLARDTYETLVEQGRGDLDHNAVWLELRRRNGLDEN